ncbi:SDR family oxidoreductase [bacterium]|nr:SDR family oxidoreductase [bacterium]
MKILLIGASSDIACHLYETYKSDYDFIRFSSNDEFSDVSNFNLQDPETYIDVEDISGIVYFPGTIVLKPFKQLGLEDFKNDYDINVLGLLKILKYYQSSLINGSSLIFISTVAAKLGMPFHSSISMCKASLEALAISLAAEWAPKVRVNCVAPSLVNTKLAKRFFRNDKQKEMMSERHPLKKTGKSEDISHTIEFLLSNKSNWVSGQVFNIDGGMSSLKI